MLTINIGWEWALGIVGMLLLMAWNGSARFAALETSMEWMKETLNELKITLLDILFDQPRQNPEEPSSAADSANLRALLQDPE